MFSFESSAVIGLYFFYKPPSFETKHKYDGKSRMDLLKELDYVGLFLFTSGCVLLLLGLNWVCGTASIAEDYSDRLKGW